MGPSLQTDRGEWEQRVHALLQRLAYYQSLVAGYRADDLFPGQTLLFAHRTESSGSGSVGSRLLAAGGPGGAWRSVRNLVQPAAEHVLPDKLGGASAAGGAGGSGPSSPAAGSAAQQVQAALAEALQRKADADDAEGLGQLSLSMMSPRPASPRHTPALGSPARTYSIVLPLNRLCPERR